MESGRTAHNIAGSDNIRLVGYVDQLNHRIQRLQEQVTTALINPFYSQKAHTNLVSES